VIGGSKSLLLDKVARSIIEGLGLESGSKAGLGAIRPCYRRRSITFVVYSYIDCR
jgi:hypothetical protein